MTGGSERLYDDDDDDQYKRGGLDTSLYTRSKGAPHEGGQSFGDYIQNQINSYFDHTNVTAVTTLASTTSQINIGRSHQRTKSTESMQPL